MVKLILIISISFLCLSLSAQTFDTIIDDRDGNKYKIVQIDNQWWTAQNANFKTLTGSWYYNNDSIKYAKNYCRLYDWDAAMLCCPEGWHLPSDEEWKQLEMETGLTQEQANSSNLRGTVEGGKLKSVGFDFWKTPNEGATDEFGFSALGTGVGGEGNFFVIGEGTSFWSSSDDGTDDKAWFRSLHHDRADIHRGFYLKKFTYSVRCVKDQETLGLNNKKGYSDIIHMEQSANDIKVYLNQNKTRYLLNIINLSGSLVHHQMISHSTNINISDFLNGIYLLKIQANNYSKSYKFLK